MRTPTLHSLTFPYGGAQSVTTLEIGDSVYRAHGTAGTPGLTLQPTTAENGDMPTAGVAVGDVVADHSVCYRVAPGQDGPVLAPIIDARGIAEVARLLACRRADENDEREWTSRDSSLRYEAVLGGVSAWPVGPRKVHASVPDTADGRMWGYVASEVLDAASQHIDHRHGEITQLSPTSWQLTW